MSTIPPEEALARNPLAFDFFRAVRLLECAHRDQPRVGYSRSPHQDPLRFGQNPSLAFAPSTLERFQPATPDEPARLLINFFGLLGPNGALPTHLTEFAYERLHAARDPTLVRFLDVFHHRALSLFYRAWADAHKAVDLDRPEGARFVGYLGSFFGLGTPALRGRDTVPDWTKVFFAGRLAPQARNAEGLGAILTEDFGLPARVQTFVGQWLKLPPDARCRLGASPASGSLGQTAIVGATFWTRQLKFRVRLGPMGRADFYRLLPNGAAFRRLRDWVLNYQHREFFWDAQLVLRAAEVPPTQLGAGGRSWLGWSCWLKSRPFTRDADDLVVPGEGV